VAVTDSGFAAPAVAIFAVADCEPILLAAGRVAAAVPCAAVVHVALVGFAWVAIAVERAAVADFVGDAIATAHAVAVGYEPVANAVAARAAAAGFEPDAAVEHVAGAAPDAIADAGVGLVPALTGRVCPLRAPARQTQEQ